MKKILAFVTLSLFLIGLGFTTAPKVKKIDPETPVADLLIDLGDQKPRHYIGELDPEKVRIGYELVHKGRATLANGKKSNFISKFYVCTDCHNQVREDADISDPTPEGRLKYAMENDLKFLQGTTFWGMVNRETFYNDDYEKKYGKLVDKARYSLEEATQLCAKECSSGRYLDPWEVDALISYYWTLQLRVEDLDLSEKELKEIAKSMKNEEQKNRSIAKLKNSYTTASRAHFGEIPENTASGYPGVNKASVENGKEIYIRSCQTCHKMYGCSQLILDRDEVTFTKFIKHLTMNTTFNLYEITRDGTHAEPGHRQYMPMYPLERLSNQQVEDLRAYIEYGEQ